ncbi:MAG TPA: NAD-dependent epimerase/dehydratase family protein [Gemmatimonadales bacterium]|nr:NAD-dependent epimerase/dehydratase family protein [Gemmatimonadales bacterium]
MTRTALVAGASGLVGGQVLQALLADADYERVTTLSRRTLPVAHRRLVQRVCDFDHLAAVTDFPRVHDVFCCLGTTIRQAGSREAFRKVDLSYVLELARVAVRYRAGQFLVVTALGADPHSRIFYSRVKGEVEEGVRRLQFDAIQIFRPALLLGRRASPRVGEGIAALLSPLVSWVLMGRLRAYRPIRAATVARAMVRVAREAPRGVHVYPSDEIARRGAAVP